MSKISTDSKVKEFTVENQFKMEMGKLVTFFCHESAFLYAKSVLIENISYVV